MHKSVIFLMEEIGGGHKSPSTAIRDSMVAIDPSFEGTPVIDLSKECGAARDNVELKDSWNRMLEHPRMTRFGNFLMNAFSWGARGGTRILYPEYYRKGAEFIRDKNPGIVFSCYHMASSIAADARERYGLGFKLISMGTDPFDALGMWIDRRVDVLMLNSEEARRVAIRRGFPAEKTMVLPYPLNNKFFAIKRSREEIRKELGLEEGKLTLLATAGGMGRGVMTGYVKKLYEKGVPANVIFVCGRNEKLAEELRAYFDPKAATTVRVLGYVTNMNELLRATDVLVAKAGAATTFEGLLSKTPIMFTDWAAYNEKPNIDYTVAHRGGWYVDSEKAFLKLVDELADGTKVAEARRNLEALNLHSGADDIARYVIAEATK